MKPTTFRRIYTNEIKNGFKMDHISPPALREGSDSGVYKGSSELKRKIQEHEFRLKEYSVLCDKANGQLEPELKKCGSFEKSETPHSGSFLLSSNTRVDNVKRQQRPAIGDGSNGREPAEGLLTSTEPPDETTERAEKESAVYRKQVTSALQCGRTVWL